MSGNSLSFWSQRQVNTRLTRTWNIGKASLYGLRDFGTCLNRSV